MSVKGAIAIARCLLIAGAGVLLMGPSLASAAGGQFSSGSTAYTGQINLRLSSSQARLTTSTGTFTCANATGSSSRLGSFGTGAITNSAISTTNATKGILTRLSFGNQLLQKSSTVVHDDTTTVFGTGGTPNATPRCTSTIAAFSGGCTAEVNASSPNNTFSAVANSSNTGITVSLVTTYRLACLDGSGNSAVCSYTTGATVGTPGPISSNLVTYNPAGSATASTVVFANAPFYRSSGSGLCPSTMTLTASYQLYSGKVYPGGAPIYVSAVP